MGADPFSTSSSYTEFFFNDICLSSGTCFFVSNANKLYLVSNWHNISGRYPHTGQTLSKNGGTPNKLRVWLQLSSDNGEWRNWGELIVELEDEQSNPLWYQHEVHGQKVDVAVIPVEIPEALNCYPINKWTQETDFMLKPGLDVFIIGFPLGVKYSGYLPIWKRASFASEPSLNINSLPLIYVDTATREGMSGSPVVIRTHGAYLDSNQKMNLGNGTFTQLVGVYSGRIGASDEDKAQLGLVWKHNLINQIIDGKHPGTYEII